MTPTARKCQHYDYVTTPLSDPYNYARWYCREPVVDGSRYCKEHLPQHPRAGTGHTNSKSTAGARTQPASGSAGEWKSKEELNRADVQD